jgi:hypothetical protein
MVSWQSSRAACRLAHRIAPGLGASLGRPVGCMRAGPPVRPRPSDGDGARRAVRGPVVAPVGPVALAGSGGAGRGATPHGIASDGSPPGPSGLSPAVAVGRAVACGPTRPSSGGVGATPSRMAPVAAPGPPASDMDPWFRTLLGDRRCGAPHWREPAQSGLTPPAVIAVDTVVDERGGLLMRQGARIADSLPILPQDDSMGASSQQHAFRDIDWSAPSSAVFRGASVPCNGLPSRCVRP